MSNSPDPAHRSAALAAMAAAAAGPGTGGTQAVRVWDLPLRLFHWSLAACLIGSFVSVKGGDGNWMEWHYGFGYAALTLILFRLQWGLVGPRYARFSSFLFSPAAVIAYLRNTPDASRTLGHTPVGSLSVFALLAAVGVQASVGLFTSDDISVEGPLARLVSNATVAKASWVHYRNEWLILGLVGLHLGAILYYKLFRRVSLVRPMVTGDKMVAPGNARPDPAGSGTRDDGAMRLRALAVLAVAVAIVTSIVNWPLF